MAIVPLLNPLTDMNPVPRVEITVPSAIAGAATATVYRIADDRTYRVRGLVGVPAAGGFGGIDTEPQFGTPVTYRAEMFDAAGLSLGFTDPASTVVDFHGTVIHQPIDPARSAAVTLLQDSAATLTRPFEGNVVRPLGRSVPVYVGNGRTGLEDVVLDSMTESAEDDASMAAVFGGYDGDEQIAVICFRTSHSTGLPGTFFAVIPAPSREAADARTGGTAVIWRLKGTEVAPPVEGIVQALLTYADVESGYATYAALEGAYLTYLDAETDFDLAGA